MATLIRNGRIVPDSWRRLDAGAARWADDENLLVPLELWLARRADWLARRGANGVLLDAADEPGAIAPDLERLALVAVNFPKFADGRGYSTARLLRERYGYRGELRAVGVVQRDQLLFMRRSGFDSFALSEGEDAVSALEAFSELPEEYQASVTRPLPLFRRRASA
jgi:uncharacterized protein (DUF934 family)